MKIRWKKVYEELNGYINKWMNCKLIEWIKVKENKY